MVFRKILFSILLGAFVLAGTSACGVYSLGAKKKLAFSSVALAPIANHANLPQAQATLARNIADSLNQEAGIKTTTANGDAELQIVIEDYSRTISATSARDSTIASAVNLRLTLSCSLLDTRSGKYFFKNRKISVSREAYVGDEVGLAETQTFPILSRDAARKVKDLLVNVW